MFSVRFRWLISLLIALSLSIPYSLATAQRDDKAPEVRVIVHTAKPYNRVRQQIQALGGRVEIEYQNADAVTATLPADRLGDLVAMPEVEWVEKDYIVQLPPAPEGELGPVPLDLQAHGIEVLPAEALEGAPETYYSYLSGVTGAQDIWAETGFGADSIVAVIDTGTAADGICLPASRVIEGPDFSPDAGTPAEGSTRAENHWHGTFVGSVIGSNCAIFLPDGDALGEILKTHLPPAAIVPVPGGIIVPLLGMAPLSTLYAVKVFPSSGAGVPSSIIEQALDHVISVKKSGALDIDVVNMSLGGPALYDGKTLEEQLVDAATDAGMTVVVAAGNEGPAPNSVATPGTAFTSLTAGAATDPVHTRIFWDFQFGPGQGLAMYPDDELRPASFSSRGPTFDERSEPEVLATGVFNFGMFTPSFCGGFFCLGWASGTSFATPTVAGGVALLNAWAENNQANLAHPMVIRSAITGGAVPLASDWDAQAQGNGYLNVANALALLQASRARNPNRLRLPEANLAPNVVFDENGEFSTHIGYLGPGRTVDLIFKITEHTSKVEIELNNVMIDPNPVPAAIPNSIELYLKSAKHGGLPYLIDSANVFGDASIVVGDGFINLSGPIFPFEVNEWPMEPGLMKLTIEGDFTNNGDVSTDVTIRRIDEKPKPEAEAFKILDGAVAFQPIEMPAGVNEAVFELLWEHNWSMYPTNDLDLFLIDPNGVFVPDFSGATLNSPEQIKVMNPMPGTWTAVVVGFDVFSGRDKYMVEVRADGVPLPDEPRTRRSRTYP